MSDKISIEKALSYITSYLEYLPSVGRFKWIVARGSRGLKGEIAGFDYGDGYRALRICGKAVFEHRLIWLIENNKWPEYDIDHIDRNRKNNLISNLREATRSENKQNQTGAYPTNKKSGLLGVYAQHNGTWQARAVVDGKTICLGTFQDKYEAHRVSMGYRSKYHKFSPYYNEGV